MVGQLLSHHDCFLRRRAYVVEEGANHASPEQSHTYSVTQKSEDMWEAKMLERGGEEGDLMQWPPKEEGWTPYGGPAAFAP
mmetsp:Transcript_57611/g.100062  ORF Transcript_57611/g.100062 Transcript_57611/m.100062 type:complete len:81 (-) Transcript_57611:135-377(-)